MYQPPNDLTGTAAIVSGASRGIGRIYALSLARAGAKVLATARTVEGDPTKPGSLAELEATAKSEGLDIAVQRVDLADLSQIEGAVAKCVERFGRLDILVNNAVSTIRFLDLFDIPAREWEDSFNINVVAPYQFMRAALPHLKEDGGGSVVNLTSLSARPMTKDAKSHGYPSYSVTKAALERLTSYAGADLIDQGVCVNAISPGHAQYYMSDGREPDMAFWGWPVVHLAAQRPETGFTGEIVHTYEFGRTWGPEYTRPPEWNERIVKMLEKMDKPYGYFAQR